MSKNVKRRIVPGVIGSAAACLLYYFIFKATWSGALIFFLLFFVLYTFVAMPLTDKYLLRKNKNRKDRDA